MTAPSFLLQPQETSTNDLGPLKPVVIFEVQEPQLGQRETTATGSTKSSEDSNGISLTTATKPNTDMGDDNDFAAIQETTKAQHEHGESLISNNFFRDPSKYEPYLEGLIKSLYKRESALGRYNHVTALTYASLGNAYRNLQEPRAIVMYRSQFRIHIMLYGKANGNIVGHLQELLLARGLTTSQISEIQKELFLSSRYEMEGDWFRRYGRRQQAFVEYHNAARLEELCFGRENPDLAYLWRKMACLAALKRDFSNDENSDDSLLIDWDEADRPGNQWMRQATRNLLSSGVCAFIRRGDHFLGMLLYSHAVGEYSKASRTLLSRVQYPHHHSACCYTTQPKKTKANQKKSRRQPPAPTTVSDTHKTADLTAELQKFLQKDSQESRVNVASDGLSFSIESLVESHDEPSLAEEQPVKRYNHVVQDIPSQHFEAQSQENILLEKRKDIIGFQKTNNTPIASKRPVPASDSSLVSALSEMSWRHVKTQQAKAPAKKEPPKSETAQTVTSRSTFVRRAPRSIDSTTSLPTVRRSSIRTIVERDDDHPDEIKKPKSDSYLAMIASRTRKAAAKAKKKIKKGAHSLRDISKASMSMDGSSRRAPNRSVPIPQEDRSRSPPPSKPKSNSGRKESSTYNMIQSPPMTPFPKKIKSSMIDSEQNQTLMATLSSTLDPPSETDGSQPQAESISDKSRGKGHGFLESFFTQFKTTGPLNEFFLSRQSSANQTVTSNVKSILSSPNGKTKTSDETEKVDNRTVSSDDYDENTDIESKVEVAVLDSPSLDKMLSDIHFLNATLQRKMVRLKHKLDLDKGAWMPSSNTGKFMPKGTKDLYGEVERLVKQCEELLSLAYKRIQDTGSVAVGLVNDSHQHAFAMENAFLEEVKRKLKKLIVVPPAMDSKRHEK